MNAIVKIMELRLMVIGLLVCCYSTMAQPTTQAGSILIYPISGSTSSLYINWSSGNGTNRVVFFKEGSSNFIPLHNITYTANANYSLATDYDATAALAKCVYNGSGNTLTVTNLAAATSYTIQIYEYNGTAGSELYHQSASSDNPVVFTYLTASSGTYTVPTGINSIVVDAWGAGGGGAGGAPGGNNSGDGGGGGAFSRSPLSVIGGTSYSYQVGLGGTGGPVGNNSPGTFGQNTFFNNSSTLMAAGGGAGGSGNTGGQASASIGSAKFSGGNGGTGFSGGPNGGGGGGASGSVFGAGFMGGNPSSNFGGIGGTFPNAPYGGGVGGAGGNSGTPGIFGQFPGGAGGGGGNQGGGTGGVGANGLIFVSFPLSAPVLTSFPNLNYTLYEPTFVLTAPTSNSAGAFTYSSSDGTVATVSGNVVTILGAGTTTITAIQSTNGAYATGVITATLTIAAVETVTRFGGRTTNSLTYPNKNGQLGGQKGVNRNGKEETTKN